MKYFGVIAFICFGYILIAPIIFSWFFPTYLDAIPYSIAFACIPLFGALLPIKTYLTTIKATQALYVISIIPPATRIGVALLLIPSFGLWGVVSSMISEALIRSLLLLYYFLRS